MSESRTLGYALAVGGLVLVGWLLLRPRKPTPRPLSPPLPPSPPPPKSAFADDLVEHALHDLGVVETSPNGGPRVDQMLANYGLGTGYNWCAVAVGTWVRETAVERDESPPILGSPSVVTTLKQFQDAKNPRVGWVDALALRVDPTLVRPGMVVFWKRGAAGSGLGHTGVVEKFAGGREFVSIEGNSGPGYDRVWGGTRSVDAPNLLGMGFFKPEEASGATGYVVDPPGVERFPAGSQDGRLRP